MNLNAGNTMSNHTMDGDQFKSSFQKLALGQAVVKAAKDYQAEMQAASGATGGQGWANLDMDDLEDDPELMKLHADRMAAMKREAEKRQELSTKGHGAYTEIDEASFLGEVTSSKLVVCHFFHAEFERCKIVDKHIRVLAPKYFDTKFIRLDAEKAPFFITKLQIKTLPCIILFSNGVAFDRIVGFEELGARDDFPTASLERRLRKAEVIKDPKKDEDDEDDEAEQHRTSVRFGGPGAINAAKKTESDEDSDFE